MAVNMATLQLPVRSDIPAYQFSIDLESVNYNFNFRYNTRLNRWFMNILDTEENVLLSGVKVLINFDLTYKYRYKDIPPGSFFCIDETGANQNPEREDLGNTHKLLYVEAEV